MDVTIVGVGKVGGAFAIALSRAGYRVRQLIVRDRKIANKVSKFVGSGVEIKRWEAVRNIDSKLILICTSDPDIESAAEQVAEFAQLGQIVLHASGSLTSKILEPLAKRGCELGSVHPLVSVSDSVLGAELFTGAYFCVEGTKKATSASRKLVRSIGGNPFTIATDKKALYHASAVTVAGHVVALFDSGLEMLMKCGVDRNTAQKVLLPLTKSTIENLSSQSPEEALTGTFARLDVAGLDRHIKAFGDIPKEVTDVYYDLGERSLALLESKGREDPRIDEMRRMIFMAKGKRR